MTAKELREKRAPLAVEIKRQAELSHDEKHNWSAEDEANWTKVNDDYNQLTRQIDRAETAEKVEADQKSTADDTRDIGRPDANHREITRDDTGPTPEDRDLALQAWFRAGSNRLEVTERHATACQRVGINPNLRDLDMGLSPTSVMQRMREARRTIHSTMFEDRARAILAEHRALTTQTGSSGGFTIPEGFVNQLEITMQAFGGMLQVADIIRTDSGNDLPWPTATDVSNTGVLLAENTTIGSSVDPTFAVMTLNAYKYSSKLILVPVELMEDSAFDMASVLGTMLGERLGRISNTQFTTGTGSSQPNGIVTAAGTGVTTASATAIADTEIIDLEHSVDPAYRNGAGFMCHDTILAYVRKLKDSNGAFVWQPGLASGRPDTLLGRPLTINQDMDSAVTTGKKTMLFGQLSKYKIRQVRGIRFRRLDERYADTDQVGFVAFIRQDGDLLDAGTDPVKLLVQL